MPVLDAGVTKGVDQRHVDLELLQPSLDGQSSFHWPLVVWVSEQFRQFICRAP